MRDFWPYLIIMFGMIMRYRRGRSYGDGGGDPHPGGDDLMQRDGVSFLLQRDGVSSIQLGH